MGSPKESSGGKNKILNMARLTATNVLYRKTWRHEAFAASPLPSRQNAEKGQQGRRK